ncbi:MAG: cation:proton antiporter [Myxococcota bacterium]
MSLEFSELEILFLQALALMTTACLVVPVFKRVGLGGVLGYFASGVLVKWLFSASFSGHAAEELLHFAEFGVVLFLFVVGLELTPAALWRMRRDIFGLGLAQLLGCAALLGGAAYALLGRVEVATTIGFGLALSSTAVVMQLLDERGERGTRYGKKAFAVLLLQDLAIVPLLLGVEVLGAQGEGGAQGSGLGALAISAAAVALLVFAGRYLLTPLFHLVARSELRELMTASALAVVIGAAMLVDLAGLSYAMGAFIAGVMLAESAFRHEVEANIEPFRGLFLGLFFMAVGMSIDLGVVAAQWHVIAGATAGAMAIKAALVLGVGRIGSLDGASSRKLAVALCQHGEFGFVLFGAAATAGVLSPELGSTLIAIVGMSMALSPLLFAAEQRFTREEPEVLEEDFTDAGAPVLVVGFGRFGQIIAQMLFTTGVGATILDRDAERVREARSFGFRVHFGDGSRAEVLRAAGGAEACMIVVACGLATETDQTVAAIQRTFPDTPVLARAFDRRHAIRLRQGGVERIVRETFDGAISMGASVLEELGQPREVVRSVARDVRSRDLERLRHQIAGADPTDLMRVRPEPLRRS